MGVGTTEKTFRVPSRNQTIVLVLVQCNAEQPIHYVIHALMCSVCAIRSLEIMKGLERNVASAQNTLFSFLVKCSIFRSICFGKQQMREEGIFSCMCSSPLGYFLSEYKTKMTLRFH